MVVQKKKESESKEKEFKKKEIKIIKEEMNKRMKVI